MAFFVYIYILLGFLVLLNLFTYYPYLCTHCLILTIFLYNKGDLVLAALKETFLFCWDLFSLIPIYIRVLILIRICFLASNIYDDYIVFISEDEWCRSLTNGLFDPASPQQTSPPNGGGGGNGGNDNGLAVAATQNVNTLEVRRLDLYNKLQQLSFDYNGPNRGKTMNSSSLINLRFTPDNRSYMLEHLQKFHPNVINTNGFAFVPEKGFGCSNQISRERLALFTDVNT